jgi:mannosyltransferase
VETTTASAQVEAAAPGALRLPRVRSLLLWVGGLAAAGIAIRFATLGLQSYHHDEVVTAARVLPGSFGHMLHEVRISESTPPLYYMLAWWWSKAFGLGQVGLRSLSALFGVMTIPIAFLVGRELAGRRAGLITAALVAFNPMLIWYSQEARAYALLILLCAASLLFFLRFLHAGKRLDLALWSICSVLALTSHYFAAFPLAVESAWLLATTPAPRRGQVMGAVGAIGAAGLALAPLMLHQASYNHTDWIAREPLLGRLGDTAVAFVIGETGKLIGEHGHDGLALLPGVLVLSALAALIIRRADARRALPALVVGVGAVILALAAAAGGQDFVLGRNLLPALVPLLAAAAVAMASLRRAGLLLAGALCSYWLAFAMHVDLTPDLQRPDWQAIAKDLGPARDRRAIVTWALGAAPLDYYLDDGTHRIKRRPVWAREVDVISEAGAPPISDPPSPAFIRVDQDQEAGLTVTRYRAPRPLPLGYRDLRLIDTGFDSNFVMFGEQPGAVPIRIRPGPGAVRTATPGHRGWQPSLGPGAAARMRSRGCAGPSSRSGEHRSGRGGERRDRSRSQVRARRRADRSTRGSSSLRPRAGTARRGGRWRETGRGPAATGSGPRRRLHTGGCRRRGSELSRKSRAASRRAGRHRGAPSGRAVSRAPDLV